MKKGCLITIGIFVILFLLVIGIGSCGSTNNDQSTDTQDEQQAQDSTVPINQTITFGDYIVTADNFRIEDDILYLTATVTNNSPNGNDVDSIIGTVAEQAGVVLSQGNNAYDATNDEMLSKYIDPGTSQTLEFKYKLENKENIFMWEVFNDGSLGLSDQGLGSDLTININPADNTFTSEIYNDPNHG